MTWDQIIRLCEVFFLAASLGFGYYGWTREGRERRKGEREEDESFEKRLTDLRSDVDALYTRNKELWSEVQSLQQQVVERDTKIKAQQERIEAQQEQIEERDDVIKIHERRIEEARQRITELETQLKAVQNGNSLNEQGPMV